jgi:hypothetical protein
MNPVRGPQIIINKNRLPPVASQKDATAIILNTRRLGARVFDLTSHGDLVSDFATRACSVRPAFGLQGSIAATLHNLYRTIQRTLTSPGAPAPFYGTRAL